MTSTTTLDCTLLRDFFGTERMRAVFDSRALLQAWLDAEAALARAEAHIGVIPAASAEAIATVARAGAFDLDELRASMLLSQHPLVSVVRALTAAAGDAGAYVHWGATTQDIMDTGAVLQVRDAVELVEGTLDDLLDVLAALAQRHKDTAMAGRTHDQHAVPITLGLKVAVWVDELGRLRERFVQCRPRVLVGELAGAAGTLASLGEDASRVRVEFCRQLGLGVPAAPWHTARDGFGELVGLLGMLAAALEKIAMEIIHLQSTEVAEVAEGFTRDHVGSSTMPQKRNPMICEYVAACCKLVRGLVPVMQGCMVSEHERDMAVWAAEWVLVPQAFILTDGALTQLLDVIRGLSVDPDRMARNLELTAGGVMAESVMLALGRHTGRDRAHHIVADASFDALERGIPLLAALAERSDVRDVLTEEELRRLLDPSAYLGEASAIASSVAAQRRPKDAP
jgi:3-carboxy-cis,cis-muconate cycloisomerase